MKIFFIFLILNFTFFLHAEEKPRPIVSVELEWEAVEGAKGYEIQIQASDFNKTFLSKKPQFQIQIPLGQNKVRGRSSDYRGAYGEWSDFFEFDAQPQKVDLRSSYDLYQPLIRLRDYKGWVRIKWKPLVEAKGYRFYLKDENGKTIAIKETKDALITFNSRPGKFSYNVTAIYSGGIESDPSEFEPSFEISGKKLNPPTLVSTAKDHQQKVYKLKTDDPSFKIVAAVEYSPYLGDEWEVLSEHKIKNQFDAKKFTRPGRYRIAFRNTLNGFGDSDPIYQEFQIKPTPEMVGEKAF